MNKKAVKEQARAILDSKTLNEAYLKTHPDATYNSADKNAWKMLKNPQVVEELERLMDKVKPLEVNKANLIKLLTMIVQNWQDKKERTSDFLRAIEILARLVPEFNEKKSIDVYGHMSEEQLNNEISDRINKLGLN